MSRRRSRAHAVAVTAASAVRLGAVNDRLELLFFPPSAGSYSVAFGADATLNGGVSLNAGDHSVRLTREQLGDELTGSVSFIGSGVLTAPVLEIVGT